MTSVSLAPAPQIESYSSVEQPRHARKHSRHPTAAAPLPSFTFNFGNPGDVSPSEQNQNEQDEKESERLNMTGAGHMRRPSKPSPLPNFTFNPGADIPVVRTPSPTHPILEEMAMNQQRVSKSAKPAPLPAFTFSPGVQTLTGSPTKPEPDDIQKSSGHRRGGSEFVGGKPEGAQLLMNSPVKPEAKPAGPPVSASGFRGHTHRRSQAISVSDIDTSELIKQHAIAKARAPSNPATPQDTTFSFPKASPGSRYQPGAARSPPSSPRRGGSISGYRARTVDFSEKVDVIPRPLSMISSETEMSNSTFRGHSLSNSISSIASPTARTPPEASLMQAPLPAGNFLERRPNTADATTLLFGPEATRPDGLLAMPKRPLSASGSPMISTSGSPPPKKKHFWSTHTNESTPVQTPQQELPDPFQPTAEEQPVDETVRARHKATSERPSHQKRRKYHTWTAGIFSRKSKHRAAKKLKRSPTPPSMLRRNSDTVNDIFDADNTVVLREHSPITTRKQAPMTQQLSLPLLQPSQSEVISPTIDLDSALDPFTEDRRHSEDQTRGTVARIAKLHSSERRGIVDAFGVSHRRTESAPALSPVNRSAVFSMRQHGSNASLSEEVFDEQEEDQFLANEEEIKAHPEAQEVDLVKGNRPENTTGGLGLSSLPDQMDGVVIIDPENTQSTEDLRSSKSTIEAPVLAEDEQLKRPATSPMPFAYPNPQLHYASSTEGRTTSASLISSPDAEHLAFDLQPRQRRFNETYTDFVRSSVDDLPSLSDSVSSHAGLRVSMPGNSRPSLEQRSHSMCVPNSSKLHESWKRSSLASLNRLIPGSSHGSKTKLDGLQTEDQDKIKKKPNRMSRLMRFWRSAEEPSQAHGV